jgi:hypothetical protein
MTDLSQLSTLPPPEPGVSATPTKRGDLDLDNGKPIVINRSTFRALQTHQKTTRSRSLPQGVPLRYLASAALDLILADGDRIDSITHLARELFINDVRGKP